MVQDGYSISRVNSITCVGGKYCMEILSFCRQEADIALRSRMYYFSCRLLRRFHWSNVFVHTTRKRSMIMVFYIWAYFSFVPRQQLFHSTSDGKKVNYEICRGISVFEFLAVCSRVSVWSVYITRAVFFLEFIFKQNRYTIQTNCVQEQKKFNPALTYIPWWHAPVWI